MKPGNAGTHAQQGELPGQKGVASNNKKPRLIAKEGHRLDFTQMFSNIATCSSEGPIEALAMVNLVFVGIEGWTQALIAAQGGVVLSVKLDFENAILATTARNNVVEEIKKTRDFRDGFV